jgi:hypothetical protein
MKVTRRRGYATWKFNTPSTAQPRQQNNFPHHPTLIAQLAVAPTSNPIAGSQILTIE